MFFSASFVSKGETVRKSSPSLNGVFKSTDALECTVKVAYFVNGYSVSVLYIITDLTSV